MTVRFAALAIVLWLVGAPAGAQAQAGARFAEQWSVGARGGVVVTDQQFNADGKAWALTIARSFGPQYAVELELSGDELDFGIDYGLKHRAIGVNHLTINREPLWDPYFLIGVGLIEFDAPPGNAVREGRDFMFNLGIGGQWELVAPERVMLRADLRLRYDRNDTGQPGQNGFGDGILSLGLTVPLGR
ncbi:MAG: hypothetical protein ACK59M_07070 [Pseudomonadota bacterium]|jgi:hypothetical protein